MAEECSEVAQRISKALRFGLEEIQPGQDLKNSERIYQEMSDLLTVAKMVQRETGVHVCPEVEFEDEEKLAKVSFSYIPESATLSSSRKLCLGEGTVYRG